MKKIIAITIVFCLMMSLSIIAFGNGRDILSNSVDENFQMEYDKISSLKDDEEQIKNLIHLYFNMYNHSLKTLKPVEWDILLIENTNTDLIKEIHKYDLEYNILYNIRFKNYKNIIDFEKINIEENQAIVNLIYGADINYDHLQDVNTKIRNIKYTIKLKKSNLQWKIEAIDSDEYGAKYFKDKMKVKSLFDINESKKIAIKQALEEVKKAAIEMNKNIQNSYKNLNISEAEEGTLNGTVGIAATVSYNRDTAIEYARKYALNNAPFFYSASSDCTNFVSQCVWAGYGGWDPTGSDSVNRTRVNNKYRMTSTWYGGTGGGSSSWESVNSFYSYVKSNTGTGPRGTVYEEDKSVGSFNYSAIAKGDVLQGWPDSQNRYYHSIFISAVLKPGIPAEILYCSHSTARQDELLTKFTQWVGSGKMRGIRFNSTTY